MTLLIALSCAAVLAAVVFVIATRGSSGGGDGTDAPSDAPRSTESVTTEPEGSTIESTADTTVEDVYSEEDTSSETVTADAPAFNDPFDYRGVIKGEAKELSELGKTVFIGDSRTEGLRLYTALPSSGARVYASVGMTVSNSLTGEVKDRDGKKVVLLDALKSDPDFESAYIMLGINELGWKHIPGFTDAYGRIIDEIRAVNPEAEIYIQSLLPVTKDKSDNDDIFTNERIREFNRALSDLAVSKGVSYLNVSEAFVDDGGALPSDASTDGIHLNKAYCNLWLEYILCHRK